jgi:U3 small nucleolar RNA-associated protein 20
VLNYEAQLLAVLAAVPSMAEKHTRALVPMFLIVSGHDDSTKSSFSTRQLQQRTASFLELLAKFVNPKAAFRTNELHEVYLDILAKGDAKLQGLALGCLITYKSPKLVPYEDNLRALLDDSKFRDELVHFDLGVDGGIIDQLHRDELVPITIRVLYGIITSKRGRSSAQAAAGRKQAALSALTPCTSGELATLIDLMTEPFTSGAEGLAGRQQLGFLSLLGDVLRYIGPQTVDHWPRLIETTISMVESAQKRLSNETEVVEEQETDEVPEGGNAPLRNIRSMGIKRLVQFARSRTDFDLSPFLPAIYASVISPRIDKLEIENTQAPSGILDLIAAFAATSGTAESLSRFDERVLPKVFACMVAVKVKPSVIGRVFDVIESLLADSEAVLLPYLDPLLSYIIRLVEQLKHSPSEDLMRRLLSILSRLSTSVTNGPQAQQLAGLLGPMLRQSNKQLPEKGKINVLETLQRLYAISPDFADPTSTFFTQHYELVSNLFQSLFAPFARRALVAALEVFAKSDPSLATSVQIVADINAYSTRRMEEPDFDRRLTAFARLNDGDETPDSPREWLPLIRSALFFIHEPEELSIRTNASSLLRRFVSLVGDASTGSYVDTLSFVVLPGLRQTIRSKLELVRNEALVVISHAVKTCSGVPALVDMQVLLAEGDDEANFFSNMVHIQVHRRARAIRRLREVDLSEKSISGIFLPLLEHIINGATDVTDHHLVNEAILSIGALAKRLRWPRYNALLMRFLRQGSTKTPQQKFYIRAMSAIIDNFHFDLEAKEIVEADGDELEDEETDEVTAVGTRITEVVLTRLLPALSRFVVQKDEAEDTIRIPVALGIVKIAAALPSKSSEVEILRIITTISQILRSKDQDTRDLTRETICKIAVFLGPHWLPRVLKELREALQRGPQKHVLAVTTHAILVQATSTGDRFDLDDAAEDAFGASLARTSSPRVSRPRCVRSGAHPREVSTLSSLSRAWCRPTRSATCCHPFGMSCTPRRPSRRCCMWTRPSVGSLWVLTQTSGLCRRTFLRCVSRSSAETRAISEPSARQKQRKQTVSACR